MTCLDIANHTTSLRVGPGPLPLADRHPINVAEDIALLDHMSGGRVDFGVGRGLNSRWGAQFNPDADRRDDARNRALFDENLDIVMKAWSQDSMSYEGRFRTIPVRGWMETDPNIEIAPPHYSPEGELVEVSVLPKPLQAPHPPVWVTAMSDASYEAAGRMGYSVLGSFRTQEGLRGVIDKFHDGIRSVEGSVGTSRDRVSIQFATYIAPTTEEAEATARAGVNEYLSRQKFHTERGRRMLLGAEEKLTRADLDDDPFDFAKRHFLVCVGTPEQVAEGIVSLRDQTGLHGFQLYPSLPSVSFEQSMRSLELFGTEVMPLVEKSV